MKNLTQKFYQLKIKMQIQWAIIFLAVCSATVLGILIYGTTKIILEKNYKEDFTYNLQVSDNITEIQLDRIIELSRDLLTNTKFLGAMKDANESESIYYTSAVTHTFESIMGRLILQDMLLDEVMVIDNSGKFYCYSKRSDQGQYAKYYKAENALDGDWTDLAKENEGKEVFFGYNVLHPQENGTVISMVKYLMNPFTKKPMGYMIANIRVKLYDKAFGSNLNGNKTNYFMIVDKNSDYPLIYFRGKEEKKESMLASYLIKKENTGKYIFTDMVNDTTGWNMISVIERKELNRDSVYIGGVILFTIVILSMIGIYISRVISGRIYQPLNKLELLIEEVGEGNRNITEEFDDSEIGQLGDKFKRMVNHNLDLREKLLSSELKEREAELLLLQAQINPHFLYNTLDSLYCMAVIHEADDIADMVAALSNTFKLSLNKGNKLIKVEDEIGHIISYLDIQNMRYNNRFDLEIQVEEGLKQVNILKFILQPFVENAMYHGLEAKMGRGSIFVNGKIEGDKIIFIIKDDGVGIADLSVLEQGYGVRNVAERIHLFYGEGYGLEFESEVGKGTKVKITIALADGKEGILNEPCSGSGR